MILPVPYHKQQTPYTCAVACVRMLLDFYDLKESRKDLIEALTPDPVTGTPRQRVVHVIHEQGLHVHEGLSTWQDIRLLLEKGTPSIVNYREPTDNEGHYAVVIGFNATHVILHDPWNGERFSISFRAFTKRWYGHKTQDLSRGWMLHVA